MAKSKNDVQKMKEELTKRRPRVSPIPPEDYVSSGMTLLNMALTGRPNYGYPKGSYVYYVGDSSSGKSWLGMNLLAEASRKESFNEHQFVYDNAENGTLMDINYYFGDDVAERLMCPNGEAFATGQHSRTIKEFYYNIDIAMDRGPCIYIMDSMDALDEDTAEENFQKEKNQYIKDGEATVAGSMGMQKAKTNSTHINRLTSKLRDTKSILFLISQTRDKIGGTIPGLKTHSGGKSLKFFSHVQIWTSVKAPIKKTVKGKERELGSIIQMDIQKNRLSGWEGKLQVPFYRTLGFDDVGSCVDYLVEEKHWDATGKGEKTIRAKDFDFEGDREALIKHIEDSNSVPELRTLCGRVWKEIEDACAVKRKPRYQDPPVAEEPTDEGEKAADE